MSTIAVVANQTDATRCQRPTEDWMFILSEECRPISSFPRFIWTRVEREPLTTTVHLFGRLTAYLPHARHPHYTWAVVISYRPGKRVWTHELRPAFLQARLFAHWEFGLVLGHWILGLRLKQPLIWVKRVRPA